MRVISGWKEIADHLRQGVRTVHRWELSGLPIHRVGDGGPVFAFSEELDAWAKATPTRDLDIIRDLKAKVKSLKAEVRSLKGQLKQRPRKSRKPI
jgi:hypothetical protein